MIVPDEKIGYRPPRIHASDLRAPSLYSLLFYKIENMIIFYKSQILLKKTKICHFTTKLYLTRHKCRFTRLYLTRNTF